MRTRLLLPVALLALLTAASPVSAATGQTFNFRMSGQGAEGFWSSYPANGVLVANTVYRDTFIGTATQTWKSDGTVEQGTFVFIDSFAYKFDKKGNFAPVSEVATKSLDGTASLTIDSKLTAASVSASGSGFACSIDSSGTYTCTPATVSINGTWTGQGALLRGHSAGSYGYAGGYQSTFHGTFSSRNATATGQLSVNGTSVDLGSNQGADMFSFSNGENDVYICHSGC